MSYYVHHINISKMHYIAHCCITQYTQLDLEVNYFLELCVRVLQYSYRRGESA